MNKGIILITAMIIIQACSDQPKSIDLQGHRGYRGLYPENTVQGFIAALDAGVSTLEMDVVISKDKQVVVSHEPYFSHEISTDPNGLEISEKDEKNHNIYQLTYDEIEKYDVGLRAHPRFPNQIKVAASKPLLANVIIESEKHVAKHHLKKPHYNIEIKRNPEFDEVFHPGVQEFAQLVVDQINEATISDRVCIQSFDIGTLQEVKKIAPEITLALLIENALPFNENINRLGFSPDIYSPYFELVDEKLVHDCHQNNIRIIPWTVNEEAAVLKMIDLKVDGVITDFPARVREILHQYSISVLKE